MEMIKIEQKMVNLLVDLKNNYHVVGIKSEFEAEGTRMEEAMLLKNVISKAGLDLNIKIGGCEAIKDMFDSISLGATRIIGPMIETAYALKKFLQAAKMVYATRLDEVQLLANIETITAYENFDAMLKIPDINYLNGIVIGRVDFVGSMGLERGAINSEVILEKSLVLAKKAKKHGLTVVVGGGVSVDSIPFFKAFPAKHIDRFETRKVIFGCPAAINNPEEAFIKAVEFELLWLKYKRDNYRGIAEEDAARIEMMEERYKKSLEKIREPA
jgi:4-hydroxy-2-oxoheptanedioate aldolase